MSLGYQAKLYIKPTLVTAKAVEGDMAADDVVGNVRDLDIKMTVESVDRNTRASAEGGWNVKDTTLKDATITFDMLEDPTDEFQTQLITAFDTNVPIFAAALSKLATVAGARGLAGNFKVTSFEPSQKLKDNQGYSFELTPFSFPSWYKKPVV